MTTLLKVDLAQIDGLGDFPCPNCGTIISPDDESEETYKVLKTTEGGVLLLCKKCNNKISLVGLEALNETEATNMPRKLKGKPDDQILQLLNEGVPLTLEEICEELDKSPKIVFRALRKLFEQNKIDQDKVNRRYLLANPNNKEKQVSDSLDWPNES